MWTVEILTATGVVVDTASAATRDDGRRWARRFRQPGQRYRVYRYTGSR
jgi:hypothetical protein